MISPILFARELKFLEDLDFKTELYKSKELKDEAFIGEHPEARLAISHFGNNSNKGKLYSIREIEELIYFSEQYHKSCII